MTDIPVTAERSLREKLSDVTGRLPEGTVTLSNILDLIGREGLLVFCTLLTLPFMVPVSIPGVSTIFGAMILLIGLSIVLNRNPWLPDRFMKHTFPSDKLRSAMQKGAIWVQRMERISRPRLPAFTHGPAMARINGLGLTLGAVLLMAPFGFIPLTNTLPGLAILFLALGMLQRDGIFVLLGYVTNLVTIVYFAALLAGGGLALREVIQRIASFFS